MKYLIVCIIPLVTICCSKSIENLEKDTTKLEAAVMAYKQKKYKDHDNCGNNYPRCWQQRNYNDMCPDQGSSCKLLNDPLSSDELTAINELMDSIDNGLSSVSDYFNDADYSDLFSYLDSTSHSSLKTDLQNGTKTVIYISQNAYSISMDTNNIYIYIGDTSTLDATYNGSGIVTHVTGFDLRGVFTK